MTILQGKRVLLGVTGGIAAYKAAELLRLLVKSGASVRVVMTKSAQSFITPLTFQALSGTEVHTDLLNPDAERGMGHIELARWPDLIVVAPASANFLARLSCGLADDLLSTTCVATSSPIAVAPAMNQQMWANKATKSNLETLNSRDIKIWGPNKGEQACGENGEGRMLEPSELLDEVRHCFTKGPWAGMKVVVTAGPTQEPIDPVRYISNHSSGKMGYELAAAAAEAGAETILISGPSSLPPPANCKVISVLTAEQMLEVAIEHSQDADVFISAAAVCDYRPPYVQSHKIKKSDDEPLTLTLTQNPDIVASVANLPSKPYTVGFAAETRELEAFAKAKLHRKNLDLIIANDVSRADIGFNSDYNSVVIIDRSGQTQHSGTSTKQQLARDLIVNIKNRMDEAARTKD